MLYVLISRHIFKSNWKILYSFLSYKPSVIIKIANILGKKKNPSFFTNLVQSWFHVSLNEFEEKLDHSKRKKIEDNICSHLSISRTHTFLTFINKSNWADLLTWGSISLTVLRALAVNWWIRPEYWTVVELSRVVRIGMPDKKNQMIKTVKHFSDQKIITKVVILCSNYILSLIQPRKHFEFW